MCLIYRASQKYELTNLFLKNKQKKVFLLIKKISCLIWLPDLANFVVLPCTFDFLNDSREKMQW